MTLAALIILPFLMGGLAYWLSENFIFAGVTILAYLVGFIFLIRGWLEEKESNEMMEKECFGFLTSFISLAAMGKDMETCYKAGIAHGGEEMQEVVDSIATQDVDSRIYYLQRYFTCPEYAFFVSILRKFDEKKGDLAMSLSPLLRNIAKKEARAEERKKGESKARKEFLFLNLLSILLMSILRLGLNGFYEEYLLEDPLYLSAMGLFLALMEVGAICFAYVYAGRPSIFGFLRRKEYEKA